MLLLVNRRDIRVPENDYEIEYGIGEATIPDNKNDYQPSSYPVQT